MEYPTKNSTYSCHLKRKRGFTIVELMIAMTLLLLVLGSIVTVTLQVAKSVKFTESRVANQQHLRSVSSNLQREVRSADVLHETTANAFEFSYYSNNVLQRVRYEFDDINKQLVRIDKNTGYKRLISNQADSLLFSYYDRFGAPVTVANVSNVNVSAVRLQFNHKQASEAGPQNQIYLSGMIMLRNIS